MTENQTPKSQKQPIEEQSESKAVDKRSKFVRIRLIPIWLRVIAFLFLVMISMLIGAVIGYSVIGDGKPQDALKISTWTHIRDLVDKK